MNSYTLGRNTWSRHLPLQFLYLHNLPQTDRQDFDPLTQVFNKYLLCDFQTAQEYLDHLDDYQLSNKDSEVLFITTTTITTKIIIIIEHRSIIL
jgi:hypothetical protein